MMTLMIINIWIIKNVIFVQQALWLINCIVVNQTENRSATISTTSSLYGRLNRGDGN